jgi:Peptidase inhibitor family I36
MGLLAFGPLHAFRSGARPATPLLRPVGEGLASCPLGYLCAWQTPQFRGAGVGIFGSERDFGKFPEQLRFIAGRGASFYNHGIPAPQEGRPDVTVYAGTNFEGPWVCLANGQSLPTVPASLATTSASSAHWVPSC